jgi:hypothetical protein
MRVLAVPLFCGGLNIQPAYLNVVPSGKRRAYVALRLPPLCDRLSVACFTGTDRVAVNSTGLSANSSIDKASNDFDCFIQAKKSLARNEIAAHRLAARQSPRMAGKFEAWQAHDGCALFASIDRSERTFVATIRNGPLASAEAFPPHQRF